MCQQENRVSEFWFQISGYHKEVEVEVAHVVPLSSALILFFKQMLTGNLTMYSFINKKEAICHVFNSAINKTAQCINTTILSKSI